MIYRRKRRSSPGGGFYLFENTKNRGAVYGSGQAEFIRLRDEYGNVWTGEAEMQSEDIIRYRFRDGRGNVISGISDNYGVILRDQNGNTWRGFVD